MKIKLSNLLCFLITLLQIGKVLARDPLTPDQAEEWLKKSQEQFDASQWSNSKDVSTLMEFLTILENTEDVFTFFYNEDDMQTFGTAPFFRTTCEVVQGAYPKSRNITINMKKFPEIPNHFGIPITHTSIIFIHKKAPIILKINNMTMEKLPIDQWIAQIKKKSQQIRKIETEDDMDVFENASSLIVMILNEADQRIGETFSALSNNYPELTFAWMVRSETTKELEERMNEDFGFDESKNNRLMSIKFEDEEYYQRDLITENVVDIGSFVMEYRYSKVMLLMDETVNKVFYERKPTFFLLMKSKGRIFKTFKKITAEYENINVLYDDFSQSIGKNALTHMMSILSISSESLPVLVMLPFTEPKNGVSAKYKTHELSSKNMRDFIEQSLKGEMEFYQRGEDVGENLRVNGYTIVTLHNFEEVVLQNQKHMLVGFELFQAYTPPDLMKTINEFQNKLNSLGLENKLELGICDLFKNEMGNLVNITKIPELILFKRTGDTQERIVYSGEVQYSKVKNWVLSNLEGEEFREIDL